MSRRRILGTLSLLLSSDVRPPPRAFVLRYFRLLPIHYSIHALTFNPGAHLTTFFFFFFYYYYHFFFFLAPARLETVAADPTSLSTTPRPLHPKFSTPVGAIACPSRFF
ncbi:hypothetical protein K461DRAFT_277556, partial [Myriangium duriaei CBS 260.36]